MNLPLQVILLAPWLLPLVKMLQEILTTSNRGNRRMQDRRQVVPERRSRVSSQATALQAPRRH